MSLVLARSQRRFTPAAPRLCNGSVWPRQHTTRLVSNKHHATLAVSTIRAGEVRRILLSRHGGHRPSPSFAHLKLGDGILPSIGSHNRYTPNSSEIRVRYRLSSVIQFYVFRGPTNPLLLIIFVYIVLLETLNWTRTALLLRWARGATSERRTEAEGASRPNYKYESFDY